MKGTKIKHLLASALLILPLALQVFSGAATTVKAADDSDTTKIQIQKLAFTNPDLTGKEIPGTTGKDFGQALDGTDLTALGATPMDHVEFTAYDATAAYNGLTGSQAERGDALKDAITQNNADMIQKFTNPVTVTTENGGLADFTLNNHNGSDYAVYVIAETKSSQTTVDGKSVTQQADPIVLIMPLDVSADSDGYVHIYPKNVVKDTLTKDVGESAKAYLDGSKTPNAAVGFGETVPYTIQVTVPSDVASMDSFVLTDTPDVGLDDNAPQKADIKFEADPVDETAITTIEATPATESNGAGFTITFDKEVLAQNYAGKTLTITYSAKLTKEIKPTDTVNNRIHLNTNTNVTISKTPITTGGAWFVKESDQNAATTLPGAEFIIAKQFGNDKEDTPATFKYAVEGKAGYTWSDNKADASIFTSGADGTFDVSGLQYSDQVKANEDGFSSYVAIETKAPADYALLEKPTTFTVDKTSYDKANIVHVKDAPKGSLPSTGGMGIYIVIAVGLAIALAGVAFMRRGKHHEEV